MSLVDDLARSPVDDAVAAARAEEEIERLRRGIEEIIAGDEWPDGLTIKERLKALIQATSPR